MEPILLIQLEKFKTKDDFFLQKSYIIDISLNEIKITWNFLQLKINLWIYKLTVRANLNMTYDLKQRYAKIFVIKLLERNEFPFKKSNIIRL